MDIPRLFSFDHAHAKINEASLHDEYKNLFMINSK